MKTIAVFSAGALLVAALADVGCVVQHRVPVTSAPAPSPLESAAVAAPQPRPAVASMQPPAGPPPTARPSVTPAPAAPPIARSTIVPSNRPALGAGTNVAPPAYGGAPPAYGGAPLAYGATEAQGPTWGPRESDDERIRVTQAVAQASSQIDRLQRIQSSAVGARRDNVGDALYALERRRAKVLQDLRAMDAEPPGQRSPLRNELQRDLAELQDWLSASYALAPPPTQGMPPPSPLPPP
jgi:hypothetical protein